MDLQDLVTQAKKLKENGDLYEALKLYSMAFDVTVDEAGDYARAAGPTHIDTIKDGEKVRTILPSLLEKTKEYLIKDKTAAIISNNMGTIFAELNYIEEAKESFLQAIELTPVNEKYEDPSIALDELSKNSL